MSRFDKNFIVNKNLTGDEQELFFQGELVAFIEPETTLIDL